MTPPESVRLTPWSESDMPLLHRISAPERTEPVGGPEPTEQVEARNGRYAALDDPAVSQMYVIYLGDAPVGSIGYWEREWQDQQVYETGWSVLPEYQGRGIAV